MTAGRGPREGGLTLLELLVVIVILALVLGLSVTFLQDAGKDLGVVASANHVAALFRAARDRARASGAPAWVVFDVPRRAAHLLVKETAAEWHFEDPPEAGAFGRDARIRNGTRVPGRVGQGIQLSGGGTIHGGDVPFPGVDPGFAVELWFQRRAGRTGRGVLCTLAEGVELAAEADGRIVGRAGGLSVSSGASRVPPEAWCHVQLLYSGRDLRLYVNRVPVDVRPGQAGWTPAGAAFIVGGERGGFAGIVDEVRVSRLLPGEEYVLAGEAAFEFPAGTAVPPDGKIAVAFDAEGRLESGGSFTVRVRSPATAQEIEVSYGGSVERREAAPAAR
ncbi:MAG TPA: LamG-like jellyroll fold domain-containing protein [Planctomycetota bacterium]|nr:LamG-like jellyroll fold domain-containing protein [Planctomycetota bacterium]